jgi:acetyltransferase
VIRVDELSELVDVSVALLGQPLPRGRRVGVLAMGGGMAVMGADAVRRVGLEMPAFTPVTMKKLDEMMSVRWSRGNPVDPGGDLVCFQALWPMLEDENIDSVIVVGGVAMIRSFPDWVVLPPEVRAGASERRKEIDAGEVTDLEKTIELMKQHRKPVFFVTQVTGASSKGKAYQTLRRNHLGFYSIPERAARTLRHLVDYSEYLGVARVEPRRGV